MADSSVVLLQSAALIVGGGEKAELPYAANARALLEALGYNSLDHSEKSGVFNLLHAGSLLKRIFQLSSPDAPGLFFFGGEADPAAVGCNDGSIPLGGLAGSGTSMSTALESCLGEGVEYLSQIEQSGDIVAHGSMETQNHGLDREEQHILLSRLGLSQDDRDLPIDWSSVCCLRDDTPRMVPADLILRRAHGSDQPTSVVPLSIGCAAGKTFDHARLGAILELVERDAVARWWHGGTRGRHVNEAVLRSAGMSELVADARGDAGSKSSWFIDISSHLDIPVIAAISLDEGGAGFAFGLGCHPDPSVAAVKAFLELCQTELAYHIVDMKEQESGSGRLNETDLAHRTRQRWAGAKQAEILQPYGEPRQVPKNHSDSTEWLLDQVCSVLDRGGVSIYYAGLTRSDLMIPVAWACAPALMPYPYKRGKRGLLSTGFESEGQAGVGPIPLF